MTPRDQDFLDDALAAFDLLYFEGAIADKHVTIKWRKFRTKGQRSRYAEVVLCERPIIHVNVILAQPWVPQYFVMDTIHHELTHVMLEHGEHDLAFKLSHARFVHHAKASMWEALYSGDFLAAAAEARK